MHSPLIVGIGGTTRPGSLTERLLRVALDTAARLGARTDAAFGPQLPALPFDPSSSARGPEALRLVELVRRADGLIVATPSYHASLSGLVKNALDHVEDLRDDARPYLDGRAVGLVVVADGAQSLGPTLIAARSVVHALRGWPTPYGATIDAKGPLFEADGSPAEPVARALELVAAQVVEFARMRLALAALQTKATP